MKFKVTAEHIARGVREDDKKCALALAILDEVKMWPRTEDDLDPANDISVSNVGVNICGKEYLLSTEAQEFIAEFDLGNPVEPGEFEMNPAPSPDEEDDPFLYVDHD